MYLWQSSTDGDRRRKRMQLSYFIWSRSNSNCFASTGASPHPSSLNRIFSNLKSRSDVRDFQCFNYDPLFLPEAIMVSSCISVHYFYGYNFAASLVRLMRNCFPTELRVGLHFSSSGTLLKLTFLTLLDKQFHRDKYQFVILPNYSVKSSRCYRWEF